MLQGWRSVEEGGKSLKEACEKLLEERVRCFFRSLPYQYIYLYRTGFLISQTTLARD